MNQNTSNTNNQNNPNNPNALNPLNLNQAPATIEEDSNQLIADLEAEIANTQISNLANLISSKTESFSARMDSLSKDTNNPETLSAEYIKRFRFCEESLFDLQVEASEATKNERRLIQMFFKDIQSISPELFQKIASENSNGSLQITPEGKKFLEDLDGVIDSYDPDTKTYQKELLSLEIFNDLPEEETTQLEESFKDYDHVLMQIFEQLADSYEKFNNDLNMLNEGERYQRVLTQEKIKLSKQLGVRIELGNAFYVQDQAGNSKCYTIRGINFESTYFDKQRNLVLQCEVTDERTGSLSDEDYPDIQGIREYEFEGLTMSDLTLSNLENFDVYPVCNSFTELEERLGFHSMQQNLASGTHFVYQFNNQTCDTVVQSFDIENNQIILSDPIPIPGFEGSAFAEAIQHKETHTRLDEFRTPDGQGYSYSLEEFLSFTNRYQADEFIDVQIDHETNTLDSQELNRRLDAHHKFLVQNGLSVGKLPIEIHTGNILGNIKGDQYEIKMVSEDSIVLENLLYPKFEGENKDSEAQLSFTPAEFLKFVKDQNLGMINKEALKKQWSVPELNFNGFDVPDFEMPELPFGLMSLNDIIDISKIFGEKYQDKLKRKRDLRKSKFQGVLGQEQEALKAQNENFDSRFTFWKESFGQKGNSNTWNKELASLQDANFNNIENRAKLKALIDLLTEAGSLSALNEGFIKTINKARRQTRGVVTDPIKKFTNKDGEEVWKDRDGTKNEDAVAEALNYIFNDNGQPSSFGTQCISKNRSAFTSSMNDAKSKVDRLAKEGKMNFNEEFSRQFNKLAKGEPMDAGEYTGILQAMIDEGYGSLPQFIYYLYAGLCYQVGDKGPILDDQFIESLNYKTHPFLHAFTPHKKLLVGQKDQIWSMFKPQSKTKPAFNNHIAGQVDEFIWGTMLPLSTSSTKKHKKTVEIKAYAKEYPGYVLSKVTNSDIEKLFEVGTQTYGRLSFGSETNYNLHKDAFGQYANGFKFVTNYVENHPDNDGEYIRNLLTSGIALFGLTHGRYKTHKGNDPDPSAANRSFGLDEIKELHSKSREDMQSFMGYIREIADKLHVPVSDFLDPSSRQSLDNPLASMQAENLINTINDLSAKQLNSLIQAPSQAQSSRRTRAA